MSDLFSPVALRNLRIEKAAERKAAMAPFVRSVRVRHLLHGDGVVKALYSGKVVVRFAGDQLLLDPDELTPL